ncbi:histidine phosphatase family protein [Nocardia sp. NPDC051321]|uniref:histidine phosphatase family protein n=1 Tax=Nocardia sp. NPDC051321 TaxID=3364323 RepID=UPI0037ACC027
MRLILIRHGESFSNIDDLLAGEQSCAGLTEHGHRQARATARYLGTEKHRLGTVTVYSTPVRRARETAEPIARELDVPVRSEFPYHQLGAAEGRPRRESVPGRALPLRLSPDYPLGPGADSWAEAANRVGRALDALTHHTEVDTIVLACHRETVLAAAQHVQRITPTLHYATAEVDYTGITEWEHRPRTCNPRHWRWVLIRHNDTRHLTDGSDLSGVVN